MRWTQFRAICFAPAGHKQNQNQNRERPPSAMALVRHFTNSRRQEAQLSARICGRCGPRKRDLAAVVLGRRRKSASEGHNGEGAAADPLRLLEAERLVRRRCQASGDGDEEVEGAPPHDKATTITTATVSSEYKRPWRDVMADMLAARAGDGAGLLSVADIEVLAKDLVAAGSDTTASAVTMTIFELLRASMAARMSAGPPEEVSSPPSITVFDEAIAEAIRLDPDSLVDLRSVQELLPFTTACTKEALRLHPPAPLFWRTANEDTELGGCKVSRGAVVVTSAAVLGRDRRQWGDDADHFRPTRFLLKAEEATPERHPFVYLPFGAGQRSCLGGRVAMAQVPVIVALILRTAALRQVEQG